MAGLKVIAVKSLPDGSLDLEDLKAKAEKHKDNLAAFMVCWCYTGIDVMSKRLLRSLTHQPLESSKMVYRT